MRNDRALIDEGRQVVKEADNRQWRLGDLGITYAYADPDNARPRVAEYAEAIGLEAGTLREYVRVCQAWATTTRSTDIPWTCYRDLASRQDRYTVMTAFEAHCSQHGITTNHYRELQKFDGRKPTSEFTADRAVEQGALALEKMSTSEAVRLAADVLTRADAHTLLPSVLAQVAKAQPEAFRRALKTDPTIRHEMAAVQIEDWRDHQASIERHTAGDPTLRHLAEGDALLDLTAAVNDFCKRVDEIYPRLGSLPSETAGGLDLGASRMLRETLERGEEALAKVRAIISNGKSDLDSFLGNVLKGAS